MATVALTTTPTQIDDGTSYTVLVTNAGAVTVDLSRGGRLRPGQTATVYPEGVALTAAATSGTGTVTTATTVAPTSQAAQVAANTAAIAGLPATYGPKAQRAGYRISAGGSTGTNSSIAELHMRVAFRLPVPATRIRVHVWNKDTKVGGAGNTSGAMSYWAMYVGQAATDSLGAPTSSFTGTPTRVDGGGGFTTDATGATESVTPWTTVSLPADTDLLLSYGFTAQAGAGQVHQRSQGQSWFRSTTTSESQNGPGMTVPNTLTATNAIFHDLWIEYEYANGAAHGLFVGDSLTSGTSTTLPFRDGYSSQAPCRLGIGATVAAWHGTTLQSDWGSTEPKWNMVSAVTQPSFIDIGLGSNDFAASRTLAQVQADFATLLTKVKTLWPNVPVYVRTILPRGLTGQPETDRAAFNTWLTTRPYGIAGVFDIAATAVSNGTALATAYNSGDGIHLNTAGHAVISGVCQPTVRYVPGAAF